MDRNSKLSRRRYVKVAGATGLIGLVAGCADSGGNGGENGAENGDENGDENGEDNETGNGEDNETDDGGDGGEGIEIEPGTDIEFDAQTSAWVGIAPSEIEDEENPTLALTEGEDYTIGWPSESDGAQHNIEIRDENDEIVDDLSTEVASEPSEDQVLEFTASEEMAAYVCQPHETTMNGTLEIVSDGGGEDGEADNETDEGDGNETEDNETEDNETEDGEDNETDE